MEQKSAQELIDFQSHGLLLVAVRGVSPAEGDLAIGQSDQPGVRDRDAMSVSAEIAQYMLRSSEGAAWHRRSSPGGTAHAARP